MVNVGRKVILPPTIYGSPRFYSEAFIDAMTIVRKFGKPEYFITFTTNPSGPRSRRLCSWEKHPMIVQIWHVEFTSCSMTL